MEKKDSIHKNEYRGSSRLELEIPYMNFQN